VLYADHTDHTDHPPTLKGGKRVDTWGVDEGVLVIVVSSPQYPQVVLLSPTRPLTHEGPVSQNFLQPFHYSPLCWEIKDRFNFVGSRGGSVLIG
jgi:hypothetical protein